MAEGSDEQEATADDHQPSFEPGSELSHALDAVSVALRSEAARVLAAQQDVVRAQSRQLLEDARREAELTAQRADEMRETARGALERAASRHEALLRMMGQLAGGLSQLRDQVNAELESLRRELNSSDGDHGSHPAGPQNGYGK